MNLSLKIMKLVVTTIQNLKTNQNMIPGWWYTYPYEKYEFVSWDYEIPMFLENHKIPWFQTTNQIIIVIISSFILYYSKYH